MYFICLHQYSNLIIPSEKIPFPAVTIKSPEDLNQWAFPQRALDILAYDCVHKKSQCNETEQLRKDFQFLVEEVLERMVLDLKKHACNLNTTTLDDWKNYPWFGERNNQIHYYDNLKIVAENLAMINHQNESIGRNMTQVLWKDFATHFAKFDNFEVMCLHFEFHNYGRSVIPVICLTGNKMSKSLL